MRSGRKMTLFLMMMIISLSFCKTLTADAASVSFSLPVSIELEGNLPVKSETFEIKLVPENPSFPMPEDGTDTLSITGENTDTFAAIRYEHPGIYQYKLYQVTGNSDCTYDQAEYQLIITVTNSSVEEIGLEISAALYEGASTGKIQKPIFYNEYPVETETEVSSEVTGESTPSVKTGVEDYRSVYLLMMLTSFFVISKMLVILKSGKE